MTTSQQLFALQELDAQADRCLAQIAVVEQRIADDARLQNARRAVSQRGETIKQKLVRQAQLTQQAEELSRKARGLEERMYGGSVRTTREVAALQGEAATLQAEAKRLEDEDLLPLMEGLEEDQAWVARAVPALERMEQERIQQAAELTVELDALRQQAAALQERRRTAAAALSAATLSQYESIRKARQGQAVARVEGGMCTGCRIFLPARELQRVRSAQQAVTCISCGRILLAG